jgi:hypothetical protein
LSHDCLPTTLPSAAITGQETYNLSLNFSKNAPDTIAMPCSFAESEIILNSSSKFLRLWDTKALLSMQCMPLLQRLYTTFCEDALMPPVYY